MKFRRALGLFLALVIAPALAQQPTALPVSLPQGAYTDADDAAQYLSPPPGMRARLRDRVNATLRENPRNSVALTQRAYFYLRDGDAASARREFDAALAAAPPGSVHLRHVLWSRGWAGYEMGDHAAALADWERAMALHGGHPYWAAYTIALLYWTAGQQDVAFAWYGAAATSHPDWGNAAGVEARTRRWTPVQQDRMRALFAAWAARQQPMGDGDASVAPAPADAPDPIVPSGAKVDGTGLGEWSARWWRWALSQPVAPFLDPDGRLCALGQEGPVWFLAGTNGSFNVQRECVIPEGKHLFVPVINMVHMEVDGAHHSACDELQAAAAVNNDHLVSAVVLLDGKLLPAAAHYRVRSDGCFVLDHDEDGDIRAASDGYWMMLKPLPPGRHTLTIGANYGAPGQAYGRMLQNFEYVLHVGGRTLISDRAHQPATGRLASR